MVYTEAVILETLRISSVAAVGIPHMALESAKLGNYIIPKVLYLNPKYVDFITAEGKSRIETELYINWKLLFCSLIVKI